MSTRRWNAAVTVGIDPGDGRGSLLSRVIVTVQSGSVHSIANDPDY